MANLGYDSNDNIVSDTSYGRTLYNNPPTKGGNMGMAGAKAGAAVGGGVGAGIGGAIGYLATAEEREQARRMLEQNLQDIQGLSLPQIKQLQLGQIQQAGALTPTEEQYLPELDTALSRLSNDPEVARLAAKQEMQLTALDRMASGGLSPEDRLALEEISKRQGREARAQQESVKMAMAQRGQLGSGAEIALQAQAAQAGAEAARQEGLGTAAQAYNRQLQAMAQTGQLAGNLREQRFGEQSKIASAEDIMKQFSQGLRANTQARNVQSQNIAQQRNLSEAQRIQEANLGLRAEEQRNAQGLTADDYMRRFQKTGAVGAARGGVAQQKLQQAQQTQAMATGIGEGVGGGAGAAAGALLPV